MEEQTVEQLKKEARHIKEEMIADAEKVMEVVEPIARDPHKLVRMSRSYINHNPGKAASIISSVSLGAGMALGAYLLHRHNKKKRTVNIHEAMQQAFNFEAEGEVNEPESNVRLIPPAQKDVELGEEDVVIIEPIPSEEPDPPVVSEVAFAEESGWDYEEELKRRSPDAPYILHKDEFYDEERGWVQSTLTYYAGDNIMTDEDDAPIYNHETVTGPLRFGHGSGDPKIVYIRNEKRRAEYEVLFDPGLYSIEVLGLQIENNERVRDLKHSRTPKFTME